MKGLKAITKTINKFLAPFECTCRVGTDFCYLYDKSLIIYSFVAVDRSIKEFMESIYRLKPEIDCDIFLWSLLHELGHHLTMDEMTEEEMDDCDFIKKEIEEWHIRPTKDYYNCLDERLATEWAVDYANTHKEELATFWNELQNKILNFYKLNGIEA